VFADVRKCSSQSLKYSLKCTLDKSAGFRSRARFNESLLQDDAPTSLIHPVEYRNILVSKIVNNCLAAGPTGYAPELLNHAPSERHGDGEEKSIECREIDIFTGALFGRQFTCNCVEVGLLSF